MCFMPCNNNLDEKCNLTKNLLDEHFKFINYEICIINSKVTDNAKQLIEQSRQIAINTKKKCSACTKRQTMFFRRDYT